MSEQTTLSDKAVDRFLHEYNCTQSVLLTMLEHRNVKSELVPKIATGFGGGIGLCGSVCGALTGGIMVLGIAFGSNEPQAEKREKCYKLAGTLYKHFQRRHGTVLCHKLIQYDLSSQSGLDMAKKARVFDEKCPEFVRTVVDFLVKIEQNEQ